MIIIGAGMSGLLCGAFNPGSVIYEAGPDRESDHKALFRCKTDEIGKILGIPFKKVTVQKGLWDNGPIQPSIRANHMYSQKVTGKITGRSITDIEPGIRYIPPSDFIDRLKARCDIRYNESFNPNNKVSCPVISTIPMPAIMELMGIKPFDFSWSEIFVNRIRQSHCDSYCTMYYPNTEPHAYRASLTGDMLIIEGTSKSDPNSFQEILKSFGLPNCYNAGQFNIRQKMGKISPIDEYSRKEFITRLTIGHNIYSLGRFATWRPKVMLDDVLEDIFVIRRLIEGGNYASLNHKQGEK